MPHNHTISNKYKLVPLFMDTNFITRSPSGMLAFIPLPNSPNMVGFKSFDLTMLNMFSVPSSNKY